MTEHESIKQFFSEKTIKEIVKINKVEELAGIEGRALYFFLRGEKYRSLTPIQIKNLIPVIEKIGYKQIK